MVPHASTIAMLLNPQGPGARAQLAEAQDAARMLARPITILKATSEADIDAAFAKLSEVRAEALLVAADPFFNSRREQLIALAMRHAIPAIYEFREFPLAGGLVSYGTSLVNAYHQVGVYTARILKGEKPSELPVLQPTKFELVINLKTANALGLTIPQTLLVSADEVIE
jgi:putative ABC transport system substrate-binding protein